MSPQLTSGDGDCRRSSRSLNLGQIPSRTAHPGPPEHSVSHHLVISPPRHGVRLGNSGFGRVHSSSVKS